MGKKTKSKKNILLIGVGGTGSDAVDMLFGKIKQLSNLNGNHISAIVFDTDLSAIKDIKNAKACLLADTASVGTICDRVGKQYIRDWFECDNPAFRCQEMFKGASQWRKKSYLAFLNMMNKPKYRNTFISALEEMTIDPNASCEVYVISSVAGGTGSGSFIPIALFAKRYLRKNLGKNPIVNAMIALPDIFAKSQTDENKTKIFANAYAILRELNAINLVSRNYNDGHSTRKKAPINITIGHKDEPNVGLLFDSNDPAFWTPEAAPFSQIFILDKMNGIDSIKAHNKILGDSLYSLICTDIGGEIDSEFSNHEVVRSQTNGNNAIYASVSTSQICFPKETILDYLAHEKTLESCDSEWLKLYKDTETKIDLAKQECVDLNRRFIFDEKRYAEKYLQAYDELFENSDGSSPVISLIERGSAVFNEEGEKEGSTTTVDTYYDGLAKAINAKFPDPTKDKQLTERINKCFQNCTSDDKKRIKVDVATVGKAGVEANKAILNYFKNCVNLINGAKNSMMDGILTLDKNKDLLVNKEISLVRNILQYNDKYIHPVTALTQLCRLRLKIELPQSKSWKPWDELKKQEINKIPDVLLECQEATVEKSKYGEIGKDRFKLLLKAPGGMYTDKKTKTAADIEQLKSDVNTILTSIQSQALIQLKYLLNIKIAQYVDKLIDKYKAFFSRFAKEKSELNERINFLKNQNAGIIDSVINVYSSVEDKERIKKIFSRGGDYVTDKELESMDNIAGEGVFSSVYNALVSEEIGDKYNENDVSGYHSLFDNMVKGNKEVIKKNDVFKLINEYNVVEAISESVNGNKKELQEALKSYFTNAVEKATPSLRIDKSTEGKDLIVPSDTLVFMMSQNTAKYIKKNADLFDIRINFGSDNDDNGLTKACAEEFIKKYSGADSSRVCVVNSLPDDSVIYCTGETMDITPLRIAKFDELTPGKDPYYSHYSTAITNMDKYKTDMWNPHLGNNFHKRGNLPYMNEKMEDIWDIKLGKAIINSLYTGKVFYAGGKGEFRNHATFKYFDPETGEKRTIRNRLQNTVDKKNIAGIMDFYRDLSDYIIDEWAKSFDMDLEADIKKLGTVVTDNDVENLKRTITNSNFMKRLTSEVVKIDDKPISIIEFSYLIKTSEETLRDNDDAERILKVAYDGFFKMVDDKVNSKTNPDRFIEVYRHAVRKVYEGVASLEIVSKSGLDCKNFFKQITQWFHSANLFNDISLEKPFDSKENILIDKEFEIANKPGPVTDEVVTILNKYINEAKEAKSGRKEDDETEVTEEKSSSTEEEKKGKRNKK